jgi:hypothetical protein
MFKLNYVLSTITFWSLYFINISCYLVTVCLTINCNILLFAVALDTSDEKLTEVSSVLILGTNDKEVAKADLEDKKPSVGSNIDKLPKDSNKEKPTEKINLENHNVNKEENFTEQLVDVNSKINSLKEKRDEFIKDARNQGETPYDNKIGSYEALQKYLTDMMDDDLF